MAVVLIGTLALWQWYDLQGLITFVIVGPGNLCGLSPFMRRRNVIADVFHSTQHFINANK